VNELPNPDKEAAVAELKERIANAEIAIMSQYVGIDVAGVTALRKQMRDAGIDYKVYKNTLAQRALDELGLSDAGALMNGPTAWVFSSDPVAPAKLLKDFAKESKFVAMSGGVLTGKIVSGAELEALADLPSREVLLSQIAGVFQAPMATMAGALNALPQNVVGLIDALQQKREAEGEAA
jgi:large subunit ribosomal protein L10